MIETFIGVILGFAAYFVTGQDPAPDLRIYETPVVPELPTEDYILRRWFRKERLTIGQQVWIRSGTELMQGVVRVFTLKYRQFGSRDQPKEKVKAVLVDCTDARLIHVPSGTVVTFVYDEYGVQMGSWCPDWDPRIVRLQYEGGDDCHEIWWGEAWELVGAYPASL